MKSIKIKIIINIRFKKLSKKYERIFFHNNLTYYEGLLKYFIIERKKILY